MRSQNASVIIAAAAVVNTSDEAPSINRQVMSAEEPEAIGLSAEPAVSFSQTLKPVVKV